MENFGIISPIEVFAGQTSAIDNVVVLYGWALRLLFWAIFILYFLFALVVVRQVTLMDQTIKTPLAPLLKILAWSHMLVALMVLILAIVSL